MTTTALLLVCMLALSGLPFSSSSILMYDGPLKPIFDVINSLPLVQAYNSTKYHDQVALTDYAPVASLETSMENTYAKLKIIVTQLQATLTPKCPPTAISGSKVVGKYCYFFSTTPLRWSEAQKTCNTNMGFLAEILPANSQAFYYSIAAAFSPQAATIGPTGEFWLGISQPIGNPGITNFVYFSNNAQLQVTSLFTATTTSTNIDAVTLVSPGSTWKIYDTTNLLATRPYICQFNTVL